jgi:hypothetical protein
LIKESLRQAIRARDDYRCAYCHVSETDTGSELTIDHLRSQHHGGDDAPGNLVYCCHPCNEFKGNYWRAEPDLCLLNPLLDNMVKHFRDQDDGMLLALTDRGTNHLRVLHLNRPELIAHRVRKRFYATREAGYQAVEARMEAVEQTLQEILRRINREFGL